MIFNNTININKTSTMPSISTKRQQYHQYQQNVNNTININKTSTIPSISTKQTIYSHLKPLSIKKTTTYNVGNPGPGLGQAQYVTVLNRLMGLNRLMEYRSPLDIWIPGGNTDKYKTWTNLVAHTITIKNDNGSIDSTIAGRVNECS